MYVHLSEMQPALLNPQGSILLDDDALPHVGWMILQKLTDSEYETLFHPLSYPGPSFIDKHFFKNLDTFFSPQNIPFL